MPGGDDSGSAAGRGVASAGRFVGRERELAELRAGLADVFAGHGRLFFFAGEPGIGKTRLAEEVAVEAEQRGARVLWGRAWESEGAPPYWPWVQILRGLLDGVDENTLRKRVGAGFPYLAQLLPGIGGPLPDRKEGELPDESADVGADQARHRFALFDAVTRLIVGASADRPHVLVLDDLQWADVPSLLLLRFLAREMKAAPLLALGTFRDVEARSQKQTGEILSSIAREGRVVHLGGLNEAEVGRLAAATRAGEVSDALVSRLHGVTDGNPFFVDGIVRLLASKTGGVVESDVASLPIPDEVRDAIRQRLAPLPDRAREILTVAAILGREADHAAIAEVTGTPPEEIVGQFEELRALGLVSGPHPPRAWRFAHDLFREGLLADLSSKELADLHRRAGDALEKFHGENAEEHAAELALHFFAAIPTADAAKAIDYGILAARRAMASYAWEDAVRELERVLGADGPGVRIPDRRRLDFLLDLGKSVWHSENRERYAEVFGQSIELARKLALPRELARAVLGSLGGATLGAITLPGEQLEARIALIQEALSGLDESDRMLRGRLLMELSWEHLHAGDGNYRASAADSVRFARRSGNPALLVESLWRQHIGLQGTPDDLPERLALGEEALAVARQSTDPDVRLVGRLPRLMNLLETCDMSGFDTELGAFVREVHEFRAPRFLLLAARLQATRALLVGDWTAVEEVTARLWALAGDLGPHATQAIATSIAQQGTMKFETGAIATDPDVFTEFRDVLGASIYERSTTRRRVTTVCLAELGRTREARVSYEEWADLELDDYGPGTIRASFNLPGSLGQAAVVVSFLGEESRAEPLYDRILPYAGLNLLFPFGHTCWGAADRLLGLLATTLSRWDDAERHFEDALRIHQDMGARPLIARTRSEFASMLIRRSGPGDRDRAATHLVESIAVARELGMALVLERAESMLATIDDRGKGRATGDDSVAARSVDDAEAVAGLRELVAVFRREGDYWTIGRPENRFRLRDLKGLTYIQRLIAESGRELHCIDVLRDGHAGSAPIDGGDAGEILDADAKAAYRRRIEDLREELAEAESINDPGRAAKAREEIDAITQELSAAVGLSGRDRRAARNVERARIRATRSIRDAIARIRKHDEPLGQHLSSAIRTGIYCSYTPDPTSPVTWET